MDIDLGDWETLRDSIDAMRGIKSPEKRGKPNPLKETNDTKPPKPTNFAHGWPVEQLDKQGNHIAYYRNQQEAAESTGYDHWAINKCVTGRQKTHRGYQWRRVEY